MLLVQSMLRVLKARYEKLCRNRNMNKISTATIAVFFILAFVPQAFAADKLFKAGIGANYYSPGDDKYSEIYESGSPMFTGMFSFNLFKSMELTGEVGRFQDKGEMTATEEELSFAITSFSGGIRIRMGFSRFGPYGGVGAVYYSISEDYPERLEDVKISTAGIYADAGSYLYLGDKFFVDLNFRYVSAEVKPVDRSRSVGGLRVGITFGIRF